ncbi:facilitated trehalose transporter Tret1-2 homolog [Palaemon carinicauda]|uniref:facilitated trehalose transporter Tret1-2 homolog n=1 Tax=Palaemon carinicauda TaxID=392227 RepID=UPI0035B5D3B3
MSSMSVWGYPAAALPQFEKADSIVRLSTEQASWFASLLILMCIPGAVIAASIYEKFGPRRMFLALTPVLCLSFMAMALASLQTIANTGLAQIILLACRVVQGAAVALTNSVINVYVYEICELRIRGIMTSLSEFSSSLGYLICYFLACFFSWDQIALIISTVVILPSFIGVIISPESPLWLARTGKEEEAKRVMKTVRRTEKEILSDLEAASRNKNESATYRESLQILTKKPNLKAMIASSLIFIFNQLTGYSIVTLYVVHIFEAARAGLPAQWSSVIVGTCRPVISALTAYLLHTSSRRFLLALGCTFTGIANGIIGTYFFLQHMEYDLSSLNWLPLFGLVLYMIGYSGFVGPTTWSAGVEVLPESVRSIGYGIGITCYSITAFLLSKFFVDLKIILGMHGMFWLFSGGSFIFAAVTLLYIPETLGKSLDDINDYWEKH